MATDKSKRNSLAGTGAAKNRLSPAARKKKQAYDKKLSARPEQKRKRVEANRANRKAQKNGTAKKGDGKDYDHAVGRMVPAKTNRGRKGEGNRRKRS